MPLAGRPFSRLRALVAGAAVSMTLLSGCATNGDPRDPFEPLNRGIYKFNDGADALVIKPAAQFYEAIVPQFMRTGVGNFFSNLNDVIVALNSLLQGKFSQAGADVARLAVNTTVGVLGLFDFATGMGLEKHDEDFGQTLGYWGIGDGPYIVLPILGPSNLRDTVGWVGDYFTDPEFYLIEDDPWTWIVFGTRVVNEIAAAMQLEDEAERTARIEALKPIVCRVLDEIDPKILRRKKPLHLFLKKPVFDAERGRFTIVVHHVAELPPPL